MINQPNFEFLKYQSIINLKHSSFFNREFVTTTIWFILLYIIYIAKYQVMMQNSSGSLIITCNQVILLFWTRFVISFNSALRAGRIWVWFQVQFDQNICKNIYQCVAWVISISIRCWLMLVQTFCCNEFLWATGNEAVIRFYYQL